LSRMTPVVKVELFLMAASLALVILPVMLPSGLTVQRLRMGALVGLELEIMRVPLELLLFLLLLLFLFPPNTNRDVDVDV